MQTIPLTDSHRATLREQRRAKRISQTELAERIGSSQSTVARIEAGERDPEPDTLREWCRVLGLTVTVRPVQVTIRQRNTKN